MKIGLKLIIGFIFVALIGVGVGIYGITNMKTISESDKFLYDKMTVPIAQLANLENAFGKIRVSLRDMYNRKGAGGDSARESTVADIKIVEDEIAANKSTLIDATDKKQYGTLQESWKAYRAVYDQLVALDKEGKDTEGITLLYSDAVAKVAADMSSIVDTMIATNRDSAKQTSDSNTASVNLRKTHFAF
jgi:methyl-accepting chemotaxis protein